MRLGGCLTEGVHPCPCHPIRWSSTAAHISAQDDHVVTVAPAIERVGDFAAFLAEPFDEAMTCAALRKAESVGRPAASRDWLRDMEARTGLTLAPPSAKFPSGAVTASGPLSVSGVVVA